MQESKLLILTILCVAIAAGLAGAQQTVTVVDRPDVSSVNAHYVSNRTPLAPGRWIALPVGSIEPAGWVREFLHRQRDGLTGHLGRISEWLQKPGNAWLSKEGKGRWGWEELPYWLKGYGDMAYILGDEAMIAETKVWIEGAINSQRPDGDFGPNQRFDDGTRDYWANMIMLFCLQSYHEYSGDQRVLILMSRYFGYQLTVPDEAFLTHYWQRMRGGDNLYSVYWLYNRTGEPWLLELAQKIHRNTANWKQPGDLPNWHNVNIAQAFGEPATYYLQSHDPTDLQAAYDNFREVRRRYGQVPGGMFGGDENCRAGYDDPRQCIETCGMVEQMLSDELLFCISGDPFWADHCEEVALNTYPAAFMPDFRALRYLTAPNHVISDQKDHSPGVENGGPFLMMNPFSSRCCQHNHSHGWPYYSKHLWVASPDNGLCAALYSASRVKAKVAGSSEVVINEDTRYPFEEQIRFTVHTPQPVRFPLYLRVPGWCERPAVRINQEDIPLAAAPGQYIRLERTWKAGDRVTLEVPMRIRVRRWAKNHNSASVDYGPLTFSLKIKERLVKFESDETAIRDSHWQKDVNKAEWPSYEIHPDSPWNMGLVLDDEAPESSFRLQRHPWPADDFPFTLEGVPLSLEARARQIPAWQLDRYGLCAVLQDSPVRSDRPEETVTLVPMGAARLRIAALPVIGQGPDARDWIAPLK
ncbi:MAG: glycoside hydrolase family 127 protein [Sedimentisphaerales bacterium]|nr:glycoside hydrolase family 127 protein [Sedimentisphaerales bacterium]